MSYEKEDLNAPEPDPSEFEPDDSFIKKKKPSYLEGSISPFSVLLSFSFVVLCFWVSNRYWSDPKNLEYYIMQKDLYSSFLPLKAALSVLNHADLKHFLGNAPLLFIFGLLLHNYYGFLIFPCLSFVAACFIQALTIYFYDDPSVRLLGASSMLYFMAALWLVWYFRYEKKKKRIHKILRVCAFTLVLLFPSTYSPQTSYLGHFLGFLVGVLLGVIFFPFIDQKVERL